MKKDRRPDAAEALAPLLASFSREIEERSLRLAEIELRLHESHAHPLPSDEMRELESEAATHRRELRRCREELERLGCSVVGTTPLTISISKRVGGERGSLWQREARR